MCKVCEHDKLGLIDRLLAEGKAQREIARRFGLTKDTVNRHVRSQHSVPSDPDGEASDGLGDEATPAQMVRAALRRIRQVDLRRMSPNQVVQHAEAIRKISESLSRLEDDPSKKVIQARVEDVVGLPAQLGRWAEALEPYPDAREAMLLATDEALLEAAGIRP